MKYNWDIFTAGAVFIIFFAMLFSAIRFETNERFECRKAAIEKNMPAAEIQAVCK